VKYISGRSMEILCGALEAHEAARRVGGARELHARRAQPEALILLRIACACEGDPGVRGQLESILSEAIRDCGIRSGPEPGGRIDMARLSDRLQGGELAQKLRALEMLVWYPMRDAVPVLAAHAARETDSWMQAAIALVLGEIGDRSALGPLGVLAGSSEDRVVGCARWAIARLATAPAIAPAPPANPPPAVEPSGGSSAPGASDSSDSSDAGSVHCPACQSVVALSRKTMGDMVGCGACGTCFRVRLERKAGAGGADTWQTSAEAVAEPERPGRKIESLYQVVSVLGRGGQGAVYRVRPKDGEREFALKYTDSHAASGGHALLAKQDIASMLDHPNIVSVFATGNDEQRPYAVYEIVEGQPLSALIKRGPIPIARVVDIAFQILAGLAHSHEHGVVHRDLKPDNILVTRDGIAKIADFGIGVLVGPEDKLDAGDQLFTGTPGYAAPEQISGWGAIRASDVYALGVTLYEMLAGRLPFPAPTLEILLHHQVTTPPQPPSAYGADIPPRLEGVVMACLEKSPASRPRWAGAVIERLKEAARGEGMPVPLSTSADIPEPTPITSRDGFRLAGPVLASGCALFGLPLAWILTNAGAKLLANTLVWSTIGWLVAVALFMRVAVRAVGYRGLDERIPLLAADARLKLTALLMPWLVIVPLTLSSMTGSVGDRLDSLPGLIPLQVLAVLTVVAPTWIAWLEHRLQDPCVGELVRGVGVLEIRGPRTHTVHLDGSPAVRLPARVPVREGRHRLTVSGDGRSHEFSFHLAHPELHRTIIEPSPDGLVDREGASPVVPSSFWHGMMASPWVIAIAGTVIASFGLAGPLAWLGRLLF
jgi:hypothetical protein